ncbi:MAG: response regulator [Hyphomicrobiales bacterium]|nr:response regulator [Hyphomicrobiales bacterium]
MADDDPGVRSVFAETLLDEGFEVAEAENGKVAVSMCREFSPDVVILDVFMPEQDGIETLAALRRGGFTGKVITCSGGGFSENYDFLKATGQLGADLVLQKPVTPDELVQGVRRCLAGGAGR